MKLPKRLVKVQVPELERCECCDLNGTYCNSKTKEQVWAELGACVAGKNGEEYAWKIRR